MSALPKWAEDLPKGCPPSDAFDAESRDYYRLVETVPPTERDFWSHRKLYPTKAFRTDECVARSVSLFATMDACGQAAKLPSLKKKHTVTIALPPGSGVLKQTGRSLDHFSWWRADGFDPIPACVWPGMSRTA